ncbi:MAG: hypothetical protein WDZ51_16415 [Pirellulaceae bacterium]
MAKNRRQEDALALAIARGNTLEAAAREAGVSSRTVHRRMGDPEFRRLVEEARGKMFDEAAGMLAQACRGAVETLTELQKAESESIRCMAARVILEQATRYRELTDIASRLEALERLYDEKLPPSPPAN